MKTSFILFTTTLFIFLLNSLQAQNFKHYYYHNTNDYMQPEIGINTGINLPVGKFAQSSIWSEDASNAGLGAFSELYFAYNPLRTSKFQTIFTLGYSMNSINFAGLSNERFTSFEMDDWHKGYAMIGIGYKSNGKVYFGINVNAGFIAYGGGNIRLQKPTYNDIETIYDYRYDIDPDIAFKAGLVIGVKVSESFNLSLNGTFFYSSSFRQGSITTCEYIVSRDYIDCENTENNGIKYNQTTIANVQCGISLSYNIPSKNQIKLKKRIETSNN